MRPSTTCSTCSGIWLVATLCALCEPARTLSGAWRWPSAPPASKSSITGVSLPDSAPAELDLRLSQRADRSRLPGAARRIEVFSAGIPHSSTQRAHLRGSQSRSRRMTGYLSIHIRRLMEALWPPAGSPTCGGRVAPSKFATRHRGLWRDLLLRCLWEWSCAWVKRPRSSTQVR